MEVNEAIPIDLVSGDEGEAALPEREVHFQAGIDSAFLHFGTAIIEYKAPDRVLPYSKTRGLGPVPRRECVRLVSARFLDLERSIAHGLYDTEGGVTRMVVKPHPPKQQNAFELPSMANACGRLLAEWKALFAESEPPIPLAVENPKPQKNESGAWRGPPAQFAIAVVPFAIVGALDQAKGLPARFVEFRQAKADVKRGTAYSEHKNEGIERTRAIMKKNADVQGLALLDKMEGMKWKTDDICDAYLLALYAVRARCKVSTKQLARVAERIRATEAGEDAVSPTKKRKHAGPSAEGGRQKKRAKKE
jgi:hypothetical protein